MLTQIQEWLARSGFPIDVAVTPMTAGLGHTALWRVEGELGEGLVARVFPRGDDVSAAREALAMHTVREAGLPVPAVVRTGRLDGHDVLLITMAAGETVATALERDPGSAIGIGRRMGALLGEINQLPAPDGLAPDDAWIDRAGPALAPVRDRLHALPHADRLLHLDFHPKNVLMDGDRATAVIDWTNTLPGPPHIDLGRSRATLQMVRTLPTVSPAAAAAVEQFETGLVAGHATRHGDDPNPELSLAWGVGTVCVDFAPQVTNPDAWVTAELVQRLEARRDALITEVTGR